jgi:GNAT superfamily N-acetyltransferase
VQEISVRPYTEADHAACRALWAELTEYHRTLYGDPAIGGDEPEGQFDEQLASPESAGVWVADSPSGVVGFAGLLLRGERAEVEPIVVAEPARGQGAGRALLDRAIAEARRLGAAYVAVRPVARNERALAFFHGAGFRGLGRVDVFMDLRDRGRAWQPGIRLHGRDYSY